MVYHPDLFKENFYNTFVELLNDKVINVKITLATVLKKHFIKYSN